MKRIAVCEECGYFIEEIPEKLPEAEGLKCPQCLDKFLKIKMVKKMIECPHCQQALPQSGTNPMKCPHCEGLANVVVRSVPIRLRVDWRAPLLFLEAAHKVGEWFMHRFYQNLQEWNVFSFKRKRGKLTEEEKEKEKQRKEELTGECEGCGKKKLLLFRREGKAWCESCGANAIYARGGAGKELYRQAKEVFAEIPRATFVDCVYGDAESLFKKWLQDNKEDVAQAGRMKNIFRGCKKKEFNIPKDEPKELGRIRDVWLSLSTPVSPFKFFKFYETGSMICRKKDEEKEGGSSEEEPSLGWKCSTCQFLQQKGTGTMCEFEQQLKEMRIVCQKRHRKERRERLKGLSLDPAATDEKTKLTEVVFRAFQPICEGCQNLEKYKWGWRCKLGDRVERQMERISRPPKFPQTKAKLAKETYKIDLQKGLATLYWEKGRNGIKARILGQQWLKEKGWDFSDTSKYPTLFQAERLRGEPECFLLYPLTEVVPVVPGLWHHIVVYGLHKTAVLCIRADGTRQAQFFNHTIKMFKAKGMPVKEKEAVVVRHLVSIKEYFQAQREKAQTKEKKKEKEKGRTRKKGYFAIPRDKESKILKILLHSETYQVAEYIAHFPGQVTLLKFKKKKVGREVEGSKELNQLLHYWTDASFRQLLKYKLELKGCIVKEKECKATEIPKCPYCGQGELGLSWQLLVLQGIKNVGCPVCGKQANALLAMAESFLGSQKVTEKDTEKPAPA